ncbi:MAG: hypothetical protein GWN00_38495 [Aliifodinibius sp.]|nr:hypothetical protein [Fodinibius sp.]NIY30463.1 hypothetical protein [Fodinibius sp.]
MVEELKQRIMNANGRPIDISVIKDSEFDVQTNLSFAFDANLSTSAKQRVVIITAFTGFYDYPIAQYAKNAIARDVDFQSKYRRADLALAKSVASSIESVLYTRRTQVLDDTTAISGISFDGTNDNLDISLAAQKNDPIFSDMVTLFNDNNIAGMEEDFNIVGDFGLRSVEAYRNQYGSNNSVDLQQNPMLGFLDSSGSITRTGGTRSAGYIMKNGAISLIDSVPLEFAQGITIGGDVSVWDYGDMELPYSGMRPLLYKKKMEADGTPFGGSAMSYVEKYGIGLQFALVYRYNDDLATKVNDIARFEMLDS